MMQQRIVIRVSDSTKKKLSKAMKIAVSVPGIESVALQKENKDQTVVEGEGIDAVNLTNLLRKKLGSVELISVIPIGHELETWEDEDTCRTTTMQPTVYPNYPVWPYPTYRPSLPPYYVQDVGMSNQDSCVIS